MKVFCDSYEFKNLIKNATCYMQHLILTNNPNSFQNSGVIEAGLSDFHKMTLTVMKTTFENLKPISYITGTIENFQAINSGKILFPVYQPKILELTVMAWKSFCKYV